jgi:hypothetical protein
MQDLYVESLNVIYLQGKILMYAFALAFGSYSSNNRSSGTLNVKKV